MALIGKLMKGVGDAMVTTGKLNLEEQRRAADEAKQQRILEAQQNFQILMADRQEAFQTQMREGDREFQRETLLDDREHQGKIRAEDRQFKLEDSETEFRRQKQLRSMASPMDPLSGRKLQLLNDYDKAVAAGDEEAAARIKRSIDADYRATGSSLTGASTVAATYNQEIKALEKKLESLVLTDAEKARIQTEINGIRQKRDAVLSRINDSLGIDMGLIDSATQLPESLKGAAPVNWRDKYYVPK